MRASPDSKAGPASAKPAAVAVSHAAPPPIAPSVEPEPHRGAPAPSAPPSGRAKVVAGAVAGVVLLVGIVLAVVALTRHTDADCRRVAACKESGLCTASGQACVASADTDCRSSANCKLAGACSAQGGRCVAASDADCAVPCEKGFRCLARDGKCACDPARAYGCKELGLCGADDAGFCTVATDAGCKASKACVERGMCSPSSAKDACVPATDGDCAGSKLCESSGKCAAKAGVCVLSDCKRSGDCALRGGCTLKGDKCVATRAEDCSASAWCKNLGLCGFGEGRCIATEAGCKASDICRDKGDCFTRAGVDRCMTRAALDEALRNKSPGR